MSLMLGARTDARARFRTPRAFGEFGAAYHSGKAKASARVQER
jgi:hypothetical protein